MSTWTANEGTGAIFDGAGTLIGVADPTSAKALVALHNREMESANVRPPAQSFYERMERDRRGNRGQRSDYVVFDEIYAWDTRESATHDAVRDVMNEVTRRHIETTVFDPSDYYRRKAPQEPLPAPETPDGAFYRRRADDDGS